MNISEFVADLLERRGLTDAQLAGLLGYKSKTSIVRMRSQNVGIHSLETFADRLRSRLQLNAEEESALNEALCTLYWQEDFQAIQSMKRFLCGERNVETDPMVELLSDSGKAVPFLTRYKSAADIRISLSNCHHVSIYSSLHHLMHNCNAQVDHYLLLLENTAEIIEVFRKMLHVCYDPAYNPYSISGMNTKEHRGMLSSDFMVITYRDGEGNAGQDLIIFDRPNHGLIITGTPQDNFLSLLPIPQENRIPIKRTFLGFSALEDYVRYCDEFARLERNRTVYKIKADIGIDWIPTEILLSAVKQDDLPAAKDFQNTFHQLVKICKRRVKNSFEKKHPTHSILKQNALWNFVKTGRTSDHFWALRAFTPRERMRILSLLLDQVRTNPYFHIHFLKDNHFLRDEEVILYEGEGVLMTDSHTDYNLAGGHVEMMVVLPEFARLFRDYFTQILLPHHVLPESETCDLLQRMILYCESQIDDAFS